jgi:hypothetical protein
VPGLLSILYGWRKIFRASRRAKPLGSPPAARALSSADWRLSMLDIALISLGFAFLGAAILYVHACDRL